MRSYSGDIAGIRIRRVGRIGTDTTINSGDMAGILMIAVKALAKRTAELKEKEAQLSVLTARLDALELRQNQSIQMVSLPAESRK